MLGAIALVVSYFSGPMLNFGDFARYGKSLRTRSRRATSSGLPVNFLVFSLLVVVTAAATVPVFGELITDPVADGRSGSTPRSRSCWARLTFIDRHHRHQHRGQLHLARVRLLQRQPAEDQLADGRHDRRRRLGAAHAVEPVQQPGGHPLHAGDRSARFIGPLFGVLIADYYLIRKQKVVVDDLFTMSRDRELLVQEGLQPGRGRRHGRRRRSSR